MPTIADKTRSMTLTGLRQDGRQIVAPFQIVLPDNRILYCDKILRLLPGKRLVASARLEGESVLAKLFFTLKPMHAEHQGYTLLHSTGVSTPVLLASHAMTDGGVCLYSYLPDATPLDNVWPTADADTKKSLASKLLSLLAQCYQKGVYQTDLHLGNFLLHGDTLFAIDPASCESFASTSTRHDNLALLLAQLPLAEWQVFSMFIQQAFPDVDTSNLITTADRLWQKRKQAYLGKIMRDCTDIADVSHGDRRILCRRELLTPAMQTVLDNPHQLLANAHILKAGNSAMVLAADIDGRRYVMKRYRNKDLWRTLRRMLRPSRAARSWYFSHALTFAGIDTPEPVALVEVRKNGIVVDAWFITKHIDGEDLLSHWNRLPPTPSATETVGRLFHTLKKAGISHGDMKATNILVANNRYYLIDFDGSRELHSKPALEKAIRHDCERFLRNWDSPALIQQLQQVLPA